MKWLVGAIGCALVLVVATSGAYLHGRRVGFERGFLFGYTLPLRQAGFGPDSSCYTPDDLRHGYVPSNGATACVVIEEQ